MKSVHLFTGHPPALLALAALYRRAKAGREGTGADFLADMRELLKAAASTDGDARVRAIEDLRRAEHESGGLLTLDRHPRDPNIIYKVRLRPAGEDWLFQCLGQRPPGAHRSELAAWFREQAGAAATDRIEHSRGKPPAPGALEDNATGGTPVVSGLDGGQASRLSWPTGFPPVVSSADGRDALSSPTGGTPVFPDSRDGCPPVPSALSLKGGAPHPGWQAWLLDLSARAQAGKSVLPFERDDPALNAELLRVTAAILTWPEESLIRYASAVICGDSKRLQALEARLLIALRAITGDPATTLETYQILQVPRAVMLHGPLVLDLPGGTLDLGLLGGTVAISGTDLAAASAIRCAATACLTVENESVFRELAKRNLRLLLVHTSFPGAATRHLLSHLPAALPCHHFGDADPAGFDILRDLREKTRRPFRAIGMHFRPDPAAAPLTEAERKAIARLLASPVLADVHADLQAMLEHGTKGNFEQESLGQAGLRLVAACFAQV